MFFLVILIFNNTSLLEQQCDNVKLFINCYIWKSLLSGFSIAAGMKWKCMYVMFSQISQTRCYYVIIIPVQKIVGLILLILNSRHTKSNCMREKMALSVNIIWTRG